jgi:hypothetical protein
MNKLTKLPPAWHAEAATNLRASFGEIHRSFLDATRRAVWLGLFLNAIKEKGKADGSIPHGEFRPWVARNIPDLSYDTITTYMSIGRGVIETGKLQVTDYIGFADHQSKNGHPLFDHDGKLPPNVEKLIEGKTQRQLCLEFKQGKLDDDDESHPRPGRRTGEGGRRALTIDETAAAFQKTAANDWNKLEMSLTGYGANFSFLADDHRIEAQAAVLEKHLRIRRTWLNTPAAKRDATFLDQLRRTL